MLKRFAFLLAALLLCCSIVREVRGSVVCYDGFDYPSPGGLNGQNGGTGFGSNPWTLSLNNPAIGSGSMTYAIGNSSLITVGNKLAPALNNRSYRNFPTAIATANQTYWVAFRGSQSAASMPTNHGGFHLSAATGGTGAYIFLGKPGFSATNWGMDLNGSWQQKDNPATAGDRNALLVYKLVFTTTNVTVSLWVNPPSVTSEAAMGAPAKTHSAAHSTTIASMNVSLGGNASGFEFDEFRMGTTLADVTPMATLFAYDGFNYTGNLNTQNGGTGFGGAWTAAATFNNPLLATGSLTYTSGSLALNTTGNKLQPNSNSRSTRVFSSVIPTSGQTYWVSFRANQTGASMPTNHAGFHLNANADGSGPYIFLGKPGFSATNWGMDLNGSWVQKTNPVTAADKDALLVYKLVFTGTTLNVSMWINPPLTGEAQLPAPDKTHSASHSTNIAAMNVSLGGTSSGYQFDEFRFGTHFSTVAPSGPPPQQPAQEDIVLFAANATNGPSSQWQKIADPAAGGGFKMYLPQNAGTQPTILGNPTDYFEITFTAPAGVPYRMWMRMKADNNDPLMDSCYAQFDHTVNVLGASVIRIGGGSGETQRLQEATGRAVSNWGWATNGFGPRAIGNAIIFGTGGTQKIRIQKAEPGVAIDRIVLSPSVPTYFTKRPGTLLDDTSNLAESTNGAAPAPRSTTQLRVLEANIHKYRTTAEDGAEPDRTVSEFILFDADVIGTNETESNYANTLEARLEDKTGVQWYRHYDGIDQHILTRIPFAKVGDVPTNPDDVETRTASTGAKTVRARIKFNNRSIQFFVIHHDFDTPSNRTIERNELLAHMNEFPNDQRIALGDFNATSTSGEMSGFETSCVDLWKAAVDATTATAYPPDNNVSYHTRTRTNRLDYIFRHNASTLLSVAGGSIPDMRDPRTFEADNTATGLAIILGTPDDKGIRASDHNWMLMKINVN